MCLARINYKAQISRCHARNYPYSGSSGSGSSGSGSSISGSSGSGSSISGSYGSGSSSRNRQSVRLPYPSTKDECLKKAQRQFARAICSLDKKGLHNICEQTLNPLFDKKCLDPGYLCKVNPSLPECNFAPQPLECPICP